MVLDLAFGFLVLVAASYVGTTMALRGFFGREHYDSPAVGRDRSSVSDDRSPSDGVPRANDATDEDEESRE